MGPPEDYDLIAALQVSLLLASGLRETHRLCDVGCGSLRAGRMLIPYLREGMYYGIEPEQWLVEEGIERELGRDLVALRKPRFRFASDFSVGAFGEEFDFAVAQSVFSHTFPNLLRLGLGEISRALAPSGRLFATFYEAPEDEGGSPKVGRKSQVFDNGWVRKGGHSYSWPEMEDHLREAGLVGRRLSWPHPRQVWFVCARAEDEAELAAFASRLRSPYLGWAEARTSDPPSDPEDGGKGRP